MLVVMMVILMVLMVVVMVVTGILSTTGDDGDFDSADGGDFDGVVVVMAVEAILMGCPLSVDGQKLSCAPLGGVH